MTKKTIFLYGERICKYFLTISLLFSFSLQSAGAVSLDLNYTANGFSMQAVQKTYKEILDHIEKNSDYVFIYSKAVNDKLNRTTSIAVSDKQIEEVLDELFVETDFSFKKSGKQIVISEKAGTPQTTPAQGTIQIEGYVTDLSGEPLIGVNIYLKENPNVGTITDIDGRYRIQVTDRFAVLCFNYIGFAPKEETVGSQKVINVILMEDVGQLDEVVIVGYGTQKKASVVAAITTIEPGALNTGTTRSISNNLAGNLAGVIGVQRTGETGYDNSDFWIRGVSTFKDVARSPLVLVDGIERSLNDIDVAEIETFSVLKDASASAVYGVRGANGVILITTKRGQAGKTRISVSVEHSFAQPTKLPDFLGSADYMELFNDISRQNGGDNIFDPVAINKYRTGYDPEIYPDINWVDAISKDFAQNTRASFNISGGSERLRYSFVGAYYNEKGITEVDKNQDWDSSLNLNRFNMRSNVDMNITPTTLMTFSIGGYLQRRQAPEKDMDDFFNAAFKTPPFAFPKIYEDGRLPIGDTGDNPWALLTQTGFKRQARSKLETLFSLEQDLKIILPGLKVKGIFSFDYFTENNVKRGRTPFYYFPAQESDRDPETGVLTLKSKNDNGQEHLGHEVKAEYGNNSTYLETNITYDQTFGDHSVNLLLLYNQRDYDEGKIVPFRNQGLAGRSAYIYKGRYIAEFNFGYNGSENFAKGKRFGFFPSFAAGWIISDEPFMEPVERVIDKLKIRASYGLVGNDKLDRRFAYISTVEFVEGGNVAKGGYKWGTSAGWFERGGRREGEVGVADLTWETVAKTNIGFELGLLQTFHLQVDLFHEMRRDIFMERKNFPSFSGFVKTPWANYGKVKNRGVDISLDINKRVNRDLFIGLRGTLTYAKNEIVEYDEELGKIGTHRAQTGKPVKQLFGLVAEGLYTEDDFKDVSTGELKEGLPIPSFTSRVYPGDIKYADLDKDGKITVDDRTAIGGTENPELVYGLGVSVVYKNVDFGAFLQGNGRTYRILGKEKKEFVPGSGMGRDGNIYSNTLTDRWTEDNPSQDVFYPRLHIGYNEHNSQESTWWLRNMSMLRVKNLEVGYTLPKNLIRNAAMEHVRVFARGTNLFCFSDFKLWDPELGSNNGLKYPLMKTFSVGLEIRF